MAWTPRFGAAKLAERLHIFDLLRRRSVPAKRLRIFDAWVGGKLSVHKNP
jgi:hypothetical protein